MKKVSICILALIIASACFMGCYAPPNLDGVPQYELTFTDIGYKKSTDWDHAQGLGYDGENFYFAGHNDSTNESADIHIIGAQTATDKGILNKIGVLHGAEIKYNTYHDTLLVCSGGNKRTPNVREINKTSGESINYWDFNGIGENGGALITLLSEDLLILFTSSKDGARIAFSAITLKENGTFEELLTVGFDSTDLGIPQGLDIYGDYVYYLADAGKSADKNPHYIYKIDLQDSGITIATAYSFDLDEETEGLCIAADGTVYFGDADEKIYKVDQNIADWQ